MNRRNRHEPEKAERHEAKETEQKEAVGTLRGEQETTIDLLETLGGPSIPTEEKIVSLPSNQYELDEMKSQVNENVGKELSKLADLLETFDIKVQQLTILQKVDIFFAQCSEQIDVYNKKQAEIAKNCADTSHTEPLKENLAENRNALGEDVAQYAEDAITEAATRVHFFSVNPTIIDAKYALCYLMQKINYVITDVELKSITEMHGFRELNDEITNHDSAVLEKSKKFLLKYATLASRFRHEEWYLTFSLLNDFNKLTINANARLMIQKSRSIFFNLANARKVIEWLSGNQKNFGTYGLKITRFLLKMHSRIFEAMTLALSGLENYNGPLKYSVDESSRMISKFFISYIVETLKYYKQNFILFGLKTDDEQKSLVEEYAEYAEELLKFNALMGMGDIFEIPQPFSSPDIQIIDAFSQWDNNTNGNNIQSIDSSR
uniref:Exocyst complex component Sec10 n=1 Tax=Caenorhabditis tropicalis TaxID=1561998 RepID=A0A1I7U0U4_9PELO